MSNEKNPGCLGYIGDYTITRISIKQLRISWKVRDPGCFFPGCNTAGDRVAMCVAALDAKVQLWSSSSLGMRMNIRAKAL